MLARNQLAGRGEHRIKCRTVATCTYCNIALHLLAQDLSESRLPRLHGVTHLVHEVMALVHADDAAKHSRFMVEESFDDFDTNTGPLKADGKRPATVVQGVTADA